jgi:hypothetical protein
MSIIYNDEEQALFGLVKGPVWPDCCNHEAGSYVASFEVCKSLDKLDRYDLYVFRHSKLGQEICIRYGRECSEYISPGSLGEFLTRNQHEPYTTAIRILLHFGRVTWTNTVTV